MAGLQFVGVGAFILRACPYPANTPAMKRQQALSRIRMLAYFAWTNKLYAQQAAEADELYS
ncbi:hypothetical protein GCM10022228_13140 [Halomonas cibimaris]|uniref:Uncharacterized protein n=1 Tax=Halomonas cibimaris TaxID=657012 RepID=A0ABP7LNN9_9GAMM